MRYFSTFSGIGGFEWGIAGAYIEKRITGTSWQDAPQCIRYSEIDKYAIQIYQKHFPNHTNHGDITKIATDTLPDFELLTGGFPCQSFSIAGKRGGFGDTRGTLFFEIARILEAKHPRLLLLENVKGLLSHDRGATFRTIIEALDELGYDLQWQVLNSKHFGVPQNRPRIFIIGNLRGTPRPEVFPIGTIQAVPDDGHKAQDEIVTALRAKQGGPDIDQTYIAPALRASDNKRGDNQTTVLEDFYPGRVREFAESPTLRSNRAGLKVKNKIGIRRLTPLECERLQSFPDGWTEKGVDENGKEVNISDTQRYKVLGNAVTVNVVREVMKKLIKN